MLEVEVVAVTSRSSRTAPGAATVTVGHALDLAEVDVLRGALASALAERRPPGGEVVLEMSRCSFVDLTGYLVLREAAQAVRERGLVLRLLGVRVEVVRVLARLDQLLGGGVREHVTGVAPTDPAGPTPSALSDCAGDQRRWEQAPVGGRRGQR